MASLRATVNVNRGVTSTLQRTIVPLLVTAYVDRKLCACSTNCHLSSPHACKGHAARLIPCWRTRLSTLAAFGLQELKAVLGGACPASSLYAPVNVWPFNRHLGEPPSYPQDPHGQGRDCRSPLVSPSTRKEKLSLPSWTSRQPNGHVIAPLDTLDQPCADWMRATVSPVETASVSSLDHDQEGVLGCACI